MRLLAIILLLLYFLPTKAQDGITVSGVVRDSENHKTLEAVNVLLQSHDGKFMYGFTLTDAEGKYSIQYKGKRDTLSISLSGFNVEGQRKIIERRTQQVDFIAKSTSINIKEVVVKPRVIERRGDTISYNVNSFKALTDHSIGDVLRKLPGIDVDKNGQIKYNGLAISKFYIEGMDMFESRYNIATNNIQAKDIARVEVMENHQPIKVLKELTLPENAAINLRLKETAKGIWGGMLQAGAGYKPALWNAEATAMYFGRKFQNMNVYKSNNTGNDISEELTSHSDEEGLSPLTGIRRPTPPYIDKQRYLDNNIHIVSTNAISRLNKDLNLTASAYYMHDLQSAQEEAVDTYYRPGMPSLVISETIESSLNKKNTGAAFKVESNKESFYLKDRFTFAGEWNHDRGNIHNGSEEIKQHFENSRIALRNLFESTARISDFSIHFTSDTDYGTLPTTLSVSPLIYPEIFDKKANISSSLQKLDNRRFRSRNEAFTLFNTGRWDFGVNAYANAELEWMQSALQPVEQNHNPLPPAPDMQNDIYWRRIDLAVGANASYNLSRTLRISLDCPFNFMNLNVEDKIRNKEEHSNRLFLRPKFSVVAQLNQNLKLSTYAFYHENYGGIYDSYSGLIMTDYRVISNKSGQVNHTKNQSYSLTLTYANVLRSLFGSLNASYHHSQQNLMYGTTYEGTLSHIQAVLMPHAVESYNIRGSISKYLNSIRTTLSLSGAYSNTQKDVLRENERMKASLQYITAGINANTRFCPSVLLDYHLAFSQNRSRIETERKLDPIDMIRQDATLSFIINNKIAVSLSGEHYYNSTIEEGSRNIFFANSKIAYHHKRMEYSIEARNLFAKHYFSTAHYDDATGYVYSYRLNPPNVMFNISFNL